MPKAILMVGDVLVADVKQLPLISVSLRCGNVIQVVPLFYNSDYSHTDNINHIT